MPVRFFLSPDQVNSFKADQWEHDQLRTLADNWMNGHLARLDAELAPPPVAPADAGPMAGTPPTPTPSPPESLPEPAAPALPAPSDPITAPLIRPAAPAPAPSAPLPTSFAPAGDLVDYARQAAQRAGIDPDLFVRQINQESGFRTDRTSPAGAQGIAQIVPRFHPGVNTTDPRASLDYAANLMASHLKTYNGDIRKALVAYNGGGGAVKALEVGTPYAESRDYLSKILTGFAPGQGDQRAAAAPNVVTTDLSQFGDKTLTAEEASAACGPAAAARLAAQFGNAIPLKVALDAAKTVGWTPGGGMNGIANQKKLLDTLGLPAELDTSGNWDRIVSDAGAGKLVTISTPGHYFTASASRPRADGQTELYVGQSGLDLRSGKAWMTPQEIEAAMGKLNGALISDVSRAATAGDWMQQAVKDHGIQLDPPEHTLAELSTAAQKAGIARPDETVSNPFGEAFRQVGDVAGQVGGAVGGAFSQLGENVSRGAATAAGGQESVGRGSTQAADLTAAAPGEALGATGERLSAGMGLYASGQESVGRGSTEAAATANAARREHFPNITEPGHALSQDLLSLDENLNVTKVNPGAVLAIGGMTGPVGAGAKANQTLLNQFGKLKTEPPIAVPSQLEEARRFVVRKWTDRGVDLAEFQQDAARAAGRALTPDEMAYELRRLNPAGAAEMRIQNELKPAIQSVGPDADWLKVYLTHQDNIDVARAMGQRVEGAAVDAIPEANAAVRNAEATLRGRQQYLDRLQADPNTAADRIRSAQNAVNSAQRSVGLAQANFEPVRAASLGEAGRAGAAAATERQFSGGLTMADSEAGLADMATELGPARMANVESAAQQVWDYGKSLLQRKLDSGLISQQLFDDLTTTYPHYSPTRIVDYMKDPAGIPSGRKITVQSAGLKRNTVEGTTRQREDPLASFVRLAHESEALATKNEVAQAFLKLRDLTPDGKLMIREVADDVTAPRGFEKMKVFTDGTPQSYMMPEYIAKAIKEEPVAPIPLLTPLMNLFRMAATQRNPVFLASNALNDAVAYTLRTSGRLGGPQNVPKVAAELVKAYGDTFQGLFRGEFRGDTARYIQGGGAMSGFFSHSPEDALKVSQALQRTNAFAIRPDHVKEDLGRLIGQALTLKPVEAIGERIELAPRVAAMRLAEKAGASAEQAVIAGRTVTIDFSQGGTWAKVLNQVIPFFNVAVQAGAQLPRAFKENPRGFVTTAAGLLAAPTVGFEAWNRSDPQRAQDYADVPKYVKDAGLVFMLPASAQVDEKGNRKPQYLFLPLREYSPFAVLTREATDRVLGDDPRAWADLLLGAGKSVSPVSGNSGADVISTGVPLGVSTALQLSTDQDWYRGGRIVSKTSDEQASAFSKAAADALQKMGVEARPSAVEFAARDVGAGVGGMLLAGSDMVAGRARRDERIQSTPGVGGLIGRFVQDRTGERLNRAIDQPVPADLEKVLHEAGLPTPTIPYEISVRSQMTGSNSPPMELHQAERAEYQRLMSERLAERLRPIVADANWSRRPIENRNKLLEAQVKAAREYAEAKVYSGMAPDDRQKRMAAGREAAKPKPRP